MNKIDDEKKAINSLLPNGVYLKPLISSSALSDNDLVFLLRQRGVYVRNSNRNYTVPLLSSFLLSPREFDILRNRHHNKESSAKISIAQATLISKENLINIINEDNIKKIISKQQDEYNPININEYETFFEGNNTVVIKGIAIRRDWKKDIFSKETDHDWRLTIKKDNDSNLLNFYSESTIPETKKMLVKIQNDIHKRLQKDGVIEKEKKYKES